jgi:predicted NUDIX family NTP pyrophosphohydrolase
VKRAAGLLLHRGRAAALEVLLVHPGGPFWAHRDSGAWSIPKGEHDDGEDALDAARREFAEETGLPPPDGPFNDLGTASQRSGKLIRAWAVEGDLDASAVASNTFELEWPPRSGTVRSFPEVDRAGWFDLPTAREKIVGGQRPLLDALIALLGEPTGP